MTLAAAALLTPGLCRAGRDVLAEPGGHPAQDATSPGGEHVHVHSRLAEIHARYNTGHLVSRSIRRATPLIL
jgi:hypothetical protein